MLLDGVVWHSLLFWEDGDGSLWFFFFVLVYF